MCRTHHDICGRARLAKPLVLNHLERDPAVLPPAATAAALIAERVHWSCGAASMIVPVPHHGGDMTPSTVHQH